MATKKQQQEDGTGADGKGAVEVGSQTTEAEDQREQTNEDPAASGADGRGAVAVGSQTTDTEAEPTGSPREGGADGKGAVAVGSQTAGPNDAK